jgi:hypothetical protein
MEMNRNRRISPRGSLAATMIVTAFAAGITLSSMSATAQQTRGPSQQLSHEIGNVSQLSVFIVAGAFVPIAVSGYVVVNVVRKTAETSVIVLKSVGEGISSGVEISIQMTSDALKAAGVMVGSVIEAVAQSTGWALKSQRSQSDGQHKTIGYVLNETGRELLRQEKL